MGYETLRGSKEISQDFIKKIKSYRNTFYEKRKCITIWKS